MQGFSSNYRFMSILDMNRHVEGVDLCQDK